MSDFSSLGLKKNPPQRKRPLEAQEPVILEYDDYKYRAGQSSNNRLKLPKMLPYNLPAELMSRLNLPQLKMSDLNVAINVTLQKENNSDRSSDSRSNSSTLHPTFDSTPKAAKRLKSGKTLEYSVDDSVKALVDNADKLKKSAIRLYQDKRYDISLVDFIQSFILFILAIRVRESGSELQNEGTRMKSARYVQMRRKDWNNVLSFGEKIIGNFTKVINIEKGRRGTSSNLSRLLNLMGFVYYLNGFIQINMCRLLLNDIERLKNAIKVKEEMETTAQLIEYIERYQELLKKSDESLKNGEMNLSLFVIARVYPKLWSQSLTKLSSIQKNEIVLSGKLNIGGCVAKFQHGINYCLPLSEHIWDLDNLINFGGFLLKEWCLKESIRHDLIFAS